MNKPLQRLRKRELMQITGIRNERGVIAIGSMDKRG